MVAIFNTMAEVFALRLLDSLIEGGAICVCAALILRIVARQNAATRFAVWFSALVAIAVLPCFSRAWLHTGFANAAARHAAIALPESWAIYFLIGWGLLALWFSLRLGAAVWHLHGLRRNCIAVDPCELDPVLQQTLQRHAGRRRIALCTSEQVRVPTAVGLFKPAILIPRSLMGELSPAELNQVVLHELAHFRRWDDWTNLIQQAVTALLFFHPAIWWIEKKLGLEREMACDDAVLAETASPRAYAECLARLAEKTFVSRGVALAQSVLGKVRQTSARVARILDVNRPASARQSSRLGVSLVAVLAIACAGVYSRSPKLIAFERSPEAQAQPPIYENASLSAPASVPRAQQTASLAVTPVKLTERSVSRKTPHAPKIAALPPKSPKAPQEPLVHLTGYKRQPNAVPLTETFWIVIESNGTTPEQQQVHQIQMWRVTVLRNVNSAPTNPIPRKET
jgi:beta-lactamase regulating signal transducer with metallopeptidase domain